MISKRVEIDILDYKPYGMCENCKYADDSEEICKLRGCFRVFDEFKDCYVKEEKEE